MIAICKKVTAESIFTAFITKKALLLHLKRKRIICESFANSMHFYELS